MDLAPLLLSFQLALATTALLLAFSLPLAWWLAYTRSRLKPVIEALVGLPLVLPPTVLGFYFLVLFSPASGIGLWLDQHLGLRLIFSFGGLVAVSLLYSLPFMVHPLQAGLGSLPPSLKEAAYVLGKSPLTTLFRVLLPNMKGPLLTGIVLTFAHTVGEFGVVLMIGGSIPGRTRVASIAIYEEVEAMNYASAHAYSLILLGLSFSILLAVYTVNGGYFKRFWS
ncbi:MAG: molybdate ABC transporter permease subunit [Bacteroidia bacterium]|nr:molybdate ABC transporter permease subunit [Bacteroidia bacterium]